jgi:hypothetical protein
MSKKYTECGRCGKTINYGNAYVSIVRNVEQADFNITRNDDEIIVIDSQEIITLCGPCGNRFNANMIEKIVNGIPTDNSNISSN